MQVYNKYIKINVLQPNHMEMLCTKYRSFAIKYDLQSNHMEMKILYGKVLLGNIGAWHKAWNFILGRRRGKEKEKETESILGSATEKSFHQMISAVCIMGDNVNPF